jgi:colanic acid/amylovoran biosynthesis glycosyltransferase
MGNLAVISKDIGLAPKITTVFHGFDLSAYLIQHGQDVYHELFTKGDVFLPISQFWKKKLISLGCPNEKIIVCHMGVDISVFKRDAKEKESPAVKLLTVARLTEKKGHRYALLALREADLEHPQLEYHIAGDGPLMEDLKGLMHNLKLENHVVFHGKVDMDEALRLYQQADIFLLPSITSSNGDMEGIPVVLMEAMACQLPVIASNHSGIPELVIDGQTGYIVSEKDTVMIKQTLVRLVKDLSLRQRLGQLAREHVQESFNNSVLNKEILDIFFKLCHNRNG